MTHVRECTEEVRVRRSLVSETEGDFHGVILRTLPYTDIIESKQDHPKRKMFHTYIFKNCLLLLIMHEMEYIPTTKQS